MNGRKVITLVVKFFITLKVSMLSHQWLTFFITLVVSNTLLADYYITG